MGGIVGVSPNMKSGVAGKFPVGTVLNTAMMEINTTYQIAANSSITPVNNFNIGPARATNSLYRMTIYTTVYGYADHDSPDLTEIGLDVTWGTSSGSFGNRIGKSHAHKFSTGAYWNSLVNFHSTDAGTHEGSDGGWSGSDFYTQQTQVLSVTAGTSIYWKVMIWAGTSLTHWNRTNGSASNNVGHGQFMIEEIAQ